VKFLPTLKYIALRGILEVKLHVINTGFIILMEENVELHAPTTLTPEKEFLFPNG
jgi:hypothetical protein